MVTEAIEAQWDDANEIQLRVSGSCMEPLIRPGELVRLSPGRPRFGDVALVALPAGPRLHRVIWHVPFTRTWRTKADASEPWDPRVGPRGLLATATRVEGGAERLFSRRRAAASLAAGAWWRLRVAFGGRR